MVTITRGDIFGSEAEALVNPVNCAGVMGKGLALQFKKRFPLMYAHYRAECKAGRLTLGTACGFQESGRWVVCVPTKKHWRSKSRLPEITAGVAALRSFLEGAGIRSVAIPPLGCGHGGLQWSAVQPVITSGFAGSDIAVVLFAP